MTLVSESTHIFLPAAHQSAQTYHSSTTSSNDSVGGQWVLLDPQSPLPPSARFRKTFRLMNMGAHVNIFVFRLFVLTSIPYVCNLYLYEYRPRPLASRLLPAVLRWRAHARHGPRPSAVCGEFGQGLRTHVRIRTGGRPPGRLNASERRVCRAPAAQHLPLALASPHRVRNAVRRYES